MVLSEARRRFETAYFEELLAKHKGKIADVARAAGISQGACYGRLYKLGLRTRGSSSDRQRRYLDKLLRKHKWHVPTVAKKAGLSRTQCYLKLHELELIRTHHRNSIPRKHFHRLAIGEAP